MDHNFPASKETLTKGGGYRYVTRGRDTCSLCGDRRDKRHIECAGRKGRPSLHDAAKAALGWMEDAEERIEGEWGEGRSIREIESDGDLPLEIVDLRLAVANYDAQT